MLVDLWLGRAQLVPERMDIARHAGLSCAWRRLRRRFGRLFA